MVEILLQASMSLVRSTMSHQFSSVLSLILRCPAALVSSWSSSRMVHTLSGTLTMPLLDRFSCPDFLACLIIWGWSSSFPWISFLQHYPFTSYSTVKLTCSVKTESGYWPKPVIGLFRNFREVILIIFLLNFIHTRVWNVGWKWRCIVIIIIIVRIFSSYRWIV